LKPSSNDFIQSTITEYFRLSLNLSNLYKSWSAPPSPLRTTFSTMASRFSGLRLIRQDPFECLVSFITSQNNNIPRITSLLSRLRQHYGTKIGEDEEKESHFSFPTPGQLANATESQLREMGFGYRAKYIANLSKSVEERGGRAWLESLRTRDRSDAKAALVELQGVGPKVADCICLFALDKLEVVPVDTHVRAIASRFMKLPERKSVTKEVCEKIQAMFIESFGEMAGWAHTILFANELKEFKIELEDKENIENVVVKKKGGKKRKEIQRKRVVKKKAKR